MNHNHSIVMLGATGAVGGATLTELLKHKSVNQITLLGRRNIDGLNNKTVSQHKANIFESSSYSEYLNGHNAAICTLGVGEPSKMSREEFVRIDKTAVIDFARACKNAGIQHFELLSSIGISHKSSNFFLRTKGELVEELKALNFERLSIFQPSMIITPTNRYGLNQAIVLATWPIIDKLFIGPLKKFRGIKVEDLGKSMALNIFTKSKGLEQLSWKDFSTNRK